MAKKTESVSFDAVLKDVRKGHIRPLYLFYGEEMYLADELTRAIVRATFGSDKDDFNLHVLDGKESEAGTIVGAAMSFPMLADFKVVILKNAELLNKDGRDALAEYVERPLDSTRLIVQTAKPDFRQNFFKRLKEAGIAVELHKLDEREFPSWIQDLVQRAGKHIDERAAMLMAAKSDLSMREVATEIEKLITYVGTRATITDEDVETVCGVSRQNNVFELCNAVGRRNFEAAASILQNMLHYGESPVGMVAMMYRHLSILWTICDWREARRSDRDLQSHLQSTYRVFPNFFYNDYQPQAAKFRAADLQQALVWLAETDAQLKSSPLGDDMIMQLLLYRLTHPDVAV
jgi:DNA polymerase-3 subunit delta